MSENFHLFRRGGRLVKARLLGTITHVSTSEKVAALTFDDGPDPDFTPRLLDVLEEYGAKGTFFVVGQQARRHRQIVSRIVEAGHVLGNHTWDHSSLPLLTMKETREQLGDCRDVVAPYRMTLLRPPYGHMDVASRVQSLILGYKVIGWNIAAQDWNGDSAETLAGRVLGEIGPGSIILFHDALHTLADARFADRGPTVEAVRLVLQRLHGQYEFVTVPELLTKGRQRKMGWFTRPDSAWLGKLKGRTQPHEA
jgi:peptidoglycan-N-acetylglucosamine deacetylase